MNKDNEEIKVRGNFYNKLSLITFAISNLSDSPFK